MLSWFCSVLFNDIICSQFLQALRRTNIFQWGQCLSDTFITHCLHNCVIVKSYDWNFCPATVTLCALLKYMALFVSTHVGIFHTSTNDTLTVTVCAERYAWRFFSNIILLTRKKQWKKNQTNSKSILLRSHAPKVTKPLYLCIYQMKVWIQELKQIDQIPIAEWVISRGLWCSMSLCNVFWLRLQQCQPEGDKALWRQFASGSDVITWFGTM